MERKWRGSWRRQRESQTEMQVWPLGRGEERKDGGGGRILDSSSVVEVSTRLMGSP